MGRGLLNVLLVVLFAVHSEEELFEKECKKIDGLASTC